MGATRSSVIVVAALSALGATGCTGATGNHDPELTPLDPVRIAVGERKQMAVTAADADGDALEFYFQITLFPGIPDKTQPYNQNMTLERGMKWLAGSETAVFTWGPGPHHVGEHTLTIIAEDKHGGRAEATAAVSVVGGAEQGAPQFDFHPNLVLDLARSECLKARIRVDDPDSSDVTISLQGEPAGMGIKPTVDTGKEAELSWCPDREQLGDKNVHTFFAIADDGEHDPVRERMSVVIKRPGGAAGPGTSCPPTQPPVIHFAPIADQTGDLDYVIEARITDAESAIQEAFIAFSTAADPGDTEQYLSATLSQTGGDLFIGSIPPVPLLAEEDPTIDISRPVRVHYYLCAWDDDDPSGQECDMPTCDPPEQGEYSFVWSPTGTAGGCPDDAYDEGAGNDDQGLAAAIGQGEGFSLVLCPDDEDWYAVEADAGDTLTLGVGVGGEGGNLSVQVLGPDLAPTGAPAADDDPDYRLVEVAQAVAGTYRVGVSGADVADRGEVYNLVVRRVAGGAGLDCPRDAGEPNGTEPQATPLAPGSSGPFGLCGGADNEDWYELDARQGDTIQAHLSFTHSVAGDLDLYLWPPEGEHNVARSASLTDNETLEHTATESGRWLLQVKGFNGAVNTYRLELTLTDVLDGEGGDPVCDSDGGAEPNDAAPDAKDLDGGIECARIQAQGAESEEDWWRVDLAAGAGFLADMTFTHAGGDLDLALIAADGTEISKSVSVTDNETIVHPGSLEGGTVFLKISGYRGADNRYAMALRRVPFGPGGGCTPDMREPNDVRDQSIAFRFREGLAILQGLSWCGDDDWFRLSVTAGQEFLGDLQFDPAEAELSAEMVNGQGDPIGVVSAAGPGRLSLESSTVGVTHIRVFGVEDGGHATLYRFEAVVE